MLNRVPHPALALVVVLFGTAASCGSVTIERTVSQNALVPAAAGPRAIGPMLYQGETALEAGYTYQPVLEKNRTSRLAGANGELAVEHTLRARAAFGLLDQLELGINLEGASASWASARATDIGPDDRLASHLVKGGVTLRALLVGDHQLGFGANLEVDLMGLPFVTEIHESAWRKSPGAPPPGTFLGDRLRIHRGTEFYGVLRAGLFGVAEASETVAFTFGLLGQNTPRFIGIEDSRFTCTTTSDPTTCADEINPADIPNLTSEFTLTLYASMGVTLGPVQLLVQFFAHPVTTDANLHTTTPLGLDLGFRYLL